MSLSVINQIAVIFLLAVAGYFARRFNIINAQVQMGLSSLVLSLALPASILAAANKPLDPANTSTIVTVLVGAILYFAVSILLMRLLFKPFKLQKTEKTIAVLLCCFSNAGFMGLPILSIFLPANGVFFGSFFVLVFNVVFFVYAATVTSAKGKISPAAIFGNINNIASVVMIVLYLLQVRLPSPIQGTLDILGSLTTPLSMMVIGSMLATIKIRQLFATPALYVVAALRLFLFPTAIFLILQALAISGPAATVLLIISGLPSASMTVMQAEKDNCAPEFASKGVLLTTLLFLLSMPYLAFLQSML